MKEQDRARFRANIQWFNQFFDGIFTIYEIVVSQLPAEFFPTSAGYSSECYYFPRQKTVPSIPAYYSLLVEGYKQGLQVLTLVDASLIARNGIFIHEPSIVVVLHSRADKNSWLDEFALKVVRNQKLDSIRKANGVFRGHINCRYPADFIAFQVPLDKFSDPENPQEAVRQYIIHPMVDSLRRGFTLPSD